MQIADTAFVSVRSSYRITLGVVEYNSDLFQMVVQGQKLVCVITGASRGIGRAIALEVAKRAGAGSTLLLLARNSARLDLVQHEITSKRAGEVTVLTSVCDVGSATAAEFKQLLNDAKSKAGQVG